MRWSAVICAGLTIAISPRSIPLQEGGTTVVAFRTPNFVILAADSRILQGSTNQLTGCKIERIGNIFISHAGLFRDPTTGWDLQQDATKAEEKGGTLDDIADRFAALTQPSLTTAVQRLRIVDPQYFLKYCEGKHTPQIAFASVENGVPTLLLRSFFIETVNGRVRVSLDPAVDCPGNCPTGNTDVTLGNHAEADKVYAATPHFWKVNGFDLGIEKLIMAESDANPHEVSPPISILILEKTGSYWEKDHQGLCPDIKP